MLRIRIAMYPKLGLATLPLFSVQFSCQYLPYQQFPADYILFASLAFSGAWQIYLPHLCFSHGKGQPI